MNLELARRYKALIEALQEAESIIGSQITKCLMDDADESHRRTMLLRWRRLLLDCGARIENLPSSRWHTPPRKLRKSKKLNPKPRTFFLGDAQTEHISKSAARRERKAARDKE